MIGIVINTFNRAAYLVECLDSLRRSRIPEGTKIIFVDDASTDPKTIDLINDFKYPGVDVSVLINANNEKIAYSARKGYDIAFGLLGCDVVTNLDSDAIVRNDWLQVITELQALYPTHIITGFHSENVNEATGKPRHPIINTNHRYCLKSSVGGINMMMNKAVYEKYLLPALNYVVTNRSGNWDALACINAMKESKPIVCALPSVIQHIGFDSSMNHKEVPDVAASFKPLALRNVTLVTVNCDKIREGIFALEESSKDIEFGAVKLLTSAETNFENTVRIDPLSSVEAYSKFLVKKLAEYIETDYLLIVQSDGYVKNWKAWSDEFLKFDYIGATWWYKDGHNVGNGGFSLRSKKLMLALKDDPQIRTLHPEDHIICKTYRTHLERRHGITFAPEGVADRFSIEGYKQPHKQTYSGQFGFHGHHVKFINNKPLRKLKPHTVILNQPFGLGDHIFIQPIVQDYVKEGYKVVIPVIPTYVENNKHFPDCTLFDWSVLKLDYNRKEEYETNGMKVVPLRFADTILKMPFMDCMKSKYEYFKSDWHRWRESRWARDTESEEQLFTEILGLKPGEKYNLINRRFRNDESGVVRIAVSNGLKNIEMRSIPGFTLIDWSRVIAEATTIHTVSTAINYIIELLDLKAEEIHLYVRRPDEVDFRNINYLLTKRYRFHK